MERVFFFYSILNIVFIIPPSKNFENIFFNIIKTIGPINIPKTPINLNPVYIATIVNIGCIPILPTYNFGFYKLSYNRHYYPKNNNCNTKF